MKLINRTSPLSSWTTVLTGQRLSKLMLSHLVGAGILLGLSSPAIAQITQATIVEILDGNEVFVEDGAGSSDRIPAAIDTVVEFQETVVTEDSRAALAFDNGAVGRMGRNSRITVGQCIEVQQGILLAAGPANGCTATFAIGVEGTMYAIVKDENTETHRIQVLEGIVEVALSDESSPEEERIQRISAGEEVTVGPDGRFRARRTLDRQDIRVLLRSGVFNNFEGVLPDIENLEITLNNLYPKIQLPCLPGFRNCSGPIRGLF
ncbi:MAG: FecR domain-containing protein [Spirulina sp. SIO3F2]|nr:FecR domain-containing protein [Spirulina sp. SIO3F2]